MPIERLDIYSQFLLPTGVRPCRQKTIVTTDNMMQMVARGCGVAAMPRWLAEEYAANMDVVPVRLGARGIPKQIYLVARDADTANRLPASLRRTGEAQHCRPGRTARGSSMAGSVEELMPQFQRPVDRASAVCAFIEAYSTEVSAKAGPALAEEAARITPITTIAIPDLAGENDDTRLAAARPVRELGFESMLHLSSRRIASLAALDRLVGRAVIKAGFERCLVIVGNLSTAAGPVPDCASLIEAGVLERRGITVVGVGGDPKDHPVMGSADRWSALEQKCRSIEYRGMAPLIVTQFAFDADVILAWLHALCARGIAHPVCIGISGPASAARPLRYAAMCGVGASASMLKRYGISIARL